MPRGMGVDSKLMPKLARAVVYSVARYGSGKAEGFDRFDSTAVRAEEIVETRALATKEFPDLRFGFRLVERHANHCQSAFRVFSVQLNGVRELFDTRRAPSGPEIDEYHFSAKFRKRCAVLIDVGHSN